MISQEYSLWRAASTCLRYSPGAVLVKMLIEIISGLLMPLMVLVVASFINRAVWFVKGDGTLSPVVTALALMGVYYVYTQVNPVAIRLVDKALENALSENLRPQLIQKHSRISYEFLENPDTLDLISRVCDHAEKNFLAILNCGIMILRLAIQVFGTLCLLAVHVWWTLPLFVISAIPIALIARRGGKAIYESDVITTKLTRKHYYLSSILVGREAAAERALFGYTDDINRKFAATHFKRSNMVTKEIAVEEITVNGCGLILNALVIVSIFALLQSVGNNTISHGLFVSLVGSLIALARIITSSVSRLVSDASGYITFMSDYTDFFALPEMDVAANGMNKKEDLIAFHSLKIRNLRFRYTPESRYVLNGVNLDMEKGKSYSLIGLNGAGKSTLTKILLGLYRNFEGEIRLNGIDIADYSTDELCRIFSVVYQDYAKYYVSLSDNIALGKENGNLNGALKLAQLDGVAAKLPQQEQTPLGKIFENGVDVSGGEWQKVAIARALYANTPFMILDEPTASLSPMAESQLYKRFAEITNNKTSLLISHRLGSTKLSDVLFVLDNGMIAQTGTHDELMESNGIYAAMFNSQRSWYREC